MNPSDLLYDIHFYWDWTLHNGVTIYPDWCDITDVYKRTEEGRELSFRKRDTSTHKDCGSFRDVIPFDVLYDRHTSRLSETTHDW